MLYAGDGVPLRKIANLIGALPVEAQLFEALGVGDQARWTLEKELAVATIELLDVIARKGTKLKRPLINTKIRPQRRKRPVSMSDPQARSFFGGRVRYTPPAAPGATIEPLGGGWYQLPDGRKVQGREKAERAAAGT